MSPISALTKNYPMTTFFLLAYALSWWVWILYAVGGFASPIVSFGPLAAVIVLALTHGRTGLVDLFRKWFAGVSGLAGTRWR